jgi:prepilin-type N-terminal cleavage/methylation domain-containing protein
MYNLTFVLHKTRLAQSQQGFSLVESLVALTLVGLLFMPMLTSLGKAKGNVLKQTFYRKLNAEVSQVLDNMIADVKTTHRIDPTSHSAYAILERYVPNSNHTFLRNHWRINSNILQFATQTFTDTVATKEWGTQSGWLSPYITSAANTYTISTGAEVLYCGQANNCTRFTDTNGNAAYNAGVDAAPVLVSGPGAALTSPEQATKLLLKGWTFTRSDMTPSIGFTLPDTYISLPTPGFAPISRSVSSFSTNTTASSFPTGFNVADIDYHVPTRQLALVGGTNMLYLTNTEGVLQQAPITVAGATALTSVALDSNGDKAWVLDTNASVKAVWRINTATGAADTINFAYESSGITSPSAIVYDPANANSIYVLGQTSGGTVTTLSKVDWNGSSYAVGATLSLPTNLTATSNTAGGAAIDPVSGDIYIIRKNMAGIGGAETNLFRINTASPTTLDDFHITWGTTGLDTVTTAEDYFGLALDPTTNRMFISDRNLDKVYVALPPRPVTHPL